MFGAGWQVAPLFDCDFSLLYQAALISKVLKTTSCKHSLQIMANQLLFDQKIDNISWVHEVKLADGSRTEWVQVSYVDGFIKVTIRALDFCTEMLKKHSILEQAL